MNKIKQNKGSIALISLIIIAAITLIMVLGMSDSSISNSYQFKNASSNKSSYYIAESCLEEAIIRLERDSGFSSETITIDDNSSCSITVSGTTTKSINIDVTYDNYVQTYHGQAEITENGTVNNIDLTLWEEI